MTNHPYPIGPDGMYVDPRGTRWTERDAQRLQERRDAETAAAVKAREESEAQAVADREQELRAAGQQRLEDYQGQSHQRFLNSGGTESDWRSAWPSMKAAWLIAQATGDDRVAADVERLRARPAYSI